MPYCSHKPLCRSPRCFYCSSASCDHSTLLALIARIRSEGFLQEQHEPSHSPPVLLDRSVAFQAHISCITMIAKIALFSFDP